MSIEISAITTEDIRTITAKADEFWGSPTLSFTRAAVTIYQPSFPVKLRSSAS